MSPPVDIESLRRSEFPLTESCAYLNHAGTGPLPRRHVAAASAFLAACCEGKPPTTLAQSEIQLSALRGRAGALMSAGAEDIAVLSHTTQALALVPLALDWQEGDEVITFEKDYPSIVFSLMRLRRLGVKLRFIPDRGGRFELEDLRALLTPRTRLISLSLVNFVTGFRAPIEEIGALCRERGIWLVVDAVQALGAIRVHARDLGADILAAHGYKHLLSGYGVALCYCSPRARQELDITIPAWPGTMANADPSAMLDYEGAVFTGDARRFEPAVPNFAGLFGANESLQLLLDVGPAAIERRIFAFLDDLLPELERPRLSGGEPAPAGRALQSADLRLPAGGGQRPAGEKPQRACRVLLAARRHDPALAAFLQYRRRFRAASGMPARGRQVTL